MGTSLNDRVRERASTIRDAEGRLSGRDVEHWLKAERELEEPVDGPMAEATGESVGSLDHEEETPPIETDARPDEEPEPWLEQARWLSLPRYDLLT